MALVLHEEIVTMPKPHPLDGTYSYFDSQLEITVQRPSVYELYGLEYKGRFTFTGRYSVELSEGVRYYWPVIGGTVNQLTLSEDPKKVGYEVGFVIFSPNVREPDPNHGNKDLSRFIDAWAGYGSPDPTTGSVVNLQLRFLNVTFAPDTWAGFSWQPTWNDFGARSYIRMPVGSGGVAESGASAESSGSSAPPRSAPPTSSAGGREQAYELHMGDGRFLRVGAGFSEAKVEKLLHSIGWSGAGRSSQSAELSRMAELHAELGAELSHAAEHSRSRSTSKKLSRAAELHAELGAEISRAAEHGDSAEMGRAAELSAELSTELGTAARRQRGSAELGAEMNSAAEMSAELSAELGSAAEIKG